MLIEKDLKLLFHFTIWLSTSPVIHLLLLRYLVVQNIPALFGSQFLIRVIAIFITILLIVVKVIFYEHPRINSPNHLAQPFEFSIGLVTFSSIMQAISLVLMVMAVNKNKKKIYYNNQIQQPDMTVAKFLALYYMLELFFRLIVSSYFLHRKIRIDVLFLYMILMFLTYYVVVWFQINDSQSTGTQMTVINQYIIKEVLQWRGVVFTLFSALSSIIGHLIWKKYQFMQLVHVKDRNDVVSWANFIKDEPEKFEQHLIITNQMLTRFYEAQICCFHERSKMKDKKLEKMDEDELRVLISSYFKEGILFTFQQMEPHYINMKEKKQFYDFFAKEAVDDHEFYIQHQNQTLIQKIISSYVYMMQLDSQKYCELFNSDKYKNFQFEYLFDDFTMDNQMLWKNTLQTFCSNQFKLFFEGFVCLVLSFYQQEFVDVNFWSDGYNIQQIIRNIFFFFSKEINLIRILMELTFILSTLNVAKQTTPEFLFYFRMISDFLFVFLGLIWVERNIFENEIFGLIGLLLAYLGCMLVNNMVKEVKEHQEKIFFLSLLSFMTQNMKFSIREGFQISQKQDNFNYSRTMLGLCAQHMNLEQFLRVYAQLTMSRGILTSDQLRQMKLLLPYMDIRDVHDTDQTFRKRLWEGGIPFIFNSTMKYENNIDEAPDKIITDHQEPEIEEEFQRIIIRSQVQQSKGPDVKKSVFTKSQIGKQTLSMKQNMKQINILGQMGQSQIVDQEEYSNE